MNGASTDRAGTVTAAVLAGLLLSWGAAISLAPRAAARPGWRAALAAPVYVAGALVCHQRPDRSFTTAGRAWPVCARCSGIYLAAAATCLAALVLPARWRSRPDAATLRAWFGVALAPVALTWLLERAGVLAVSNGTRAVSGAALGTLVALALVSLLPRPRVRPRDLR